MLNQNISGYQNKKDQIELLNIAEGYFQSGVLFALLKLNIFEIIGEEDRSLSDLALSTGTKAKTLLRLLNAGIVLGLLESEGDSHYRLAQRFRNALLPSNGEQYLGNWIRNLEYFQSSFLDLDKAVIKSGPTVDPEEHLGVDEIKTREYILAMHNYASMRGKELANFLDTKECRKLLDLGCGPGTYAFHLGALNPEMEIYLADFPDVLKIAEELGQKYLPERDIKILPLNAIKDEIPGTYDLILVSNMLHMLNEENCKNLICRLYNHVCPGGSLVIQAQFLNDNRRGGRWPVLLDLIQLCITEDGRNHTVQETKGWLAEAGFKDVKLCNMTMLNTNSFLRGYKKH